MSSFEISSMKKSILGILQGRSQKLSKWTWKIIERKIWLDVWAWRNTQVTLFQHSFRYKIALKFCVWCLLRCSVLCDVLFLRYLSQNKYYIEVVHRSQKSVNEVLKSNVRKMFVWKWQLKKQYTAKDTAKHTIHKISANTWHEETL